MSNDEIDRTVSELTAGVDSRLEKIHRIYDYVQSKIRYVAIEVGIGGFQPHPASETFANKYGDCKDKATLLNAMLDKCGIDSWPVLVRISQIGSVEPDFPSPYQFNHCIVYVPASQYLPTGMKDDSAGNVPAELRDGLFLDATPGRCPFGELPLADQSTWALVVDDTRSTLARVPDTWVQPNLISRKTLVQLRANGSAVCSVTESSYGIENQSLRAQFFGKKEADRQEIWSRKLNSQFPRQSYLELTVANEDSLELPLELQSRFTVTKYSQRSGAMLILPASYWKVFDENPLKESIRVNDLVFSHRRSVVDTLLLELPSGYTVQSLPETAGLVQPPGEFTITCSSPSPDVVQVVRSCTIDDTRVPAADFSGVLEFIDALSAAESAKLVLSRAY